MPIEKCKGGFQFALRFADDEAMFLEGFQHFCNWRLPRNTKLRADMISRIQSSSTGLVVSAPFRWFGRDVLLPPLPQIWQKKTFKALESVRIANIKIRNVDESSLQLLRPNNMINDEIVEGYLELVRKSESRVAIGTTRLLATCSSMHPIDRAISIDSLRYTGFVLIPIHDSERSHWTFAHVMLHEDGNTITARHFDSLKSSHIPMILEKWLFEKFQGIEMKITNAESPQQKNEFDCGLYMLMGIRIMAFGSRHIPQAEADEIMPTFRQRVLAEILAGTLDPDDSAYTEFIMADEEARRVIQLDAPSAMYRGTGESDEPICFDTPISSPARAEEAQPLDKMSPETRDATSPRLSTDELNQRASRISLNPAPGSTKSIAALRVPRSQRGKTKPESSVWYLVESFADEEPMVHILKGAVMAYRTKSSAVSWPETLASLWNGVTGEGNPQHALITRHDRERFSRAFFLELRSLGWSKGRVAPGIRVQMEARLNCSGDQGTWKAAHAQASRSSIWTQLVDCTVNFLSPSSHVAICGISQSTTTVENLTLDERKVFIQGVKKRLLNSQDTALRNLQATSSLYNAITDRSLPHHAITIERIDDLKLLSYADIVNLEEPPARLRLPSQG